MPVTCSAQCLTLGPTLTVTIDSLSVRGADIPGAQHPAEPGSVHFTLGFPGLTCGDWNTCSLSGFSLIGPLLSWPEGGSPTLPSFSSLLLTLGRARTGAPTSQPGTHPWARCCAPGRPKPVLSPLPGFPGSLAGGGWEEKP